MKEKHLSDRIEFLDIIKGISIILVVFIHFNVLSDKTIIGNAVMQLAVCACPCFMMVSGFLQAGKKRKVTKVYFFSILKVYFQSVIWKILYFLFL